MLVARIDDQQGHRSHCAPLDNLIEACFMVHKITASSVVLILVIQANVACAQDHKAGSQSTPQTEAGVGAASRSSGKPAVVSDVDFVSSAEDVGFDKRLREYVAEGQRTVAAFFGSPYPDRFTVRLSPNRKAFTEFFRKKWNMSETQCWWVAAGVADTFIMLSPRVWPKEACEHDPKDEAHVKGIVIHELVHVFHGQHNPKVEELDEIGWFVEGLAAYVSGQLKMRHRGAARKAIESGAAPKRLSKAWSGAHRYGVAGSLVKYIDVTYGRDMIIKMLPVVSQTDLLGMIKLTESELLDAWHEFVMKGEDK